MLKKKTYKKNLIALAVIIAFIIVIKIVTAGSSSELNLRIAVASNFQTTAQELASEFQKQTGYNVDISTASTGILYNQISNGAPFDVFLSADAKHPELLVEKNIAVKESLIVYATGKIALWGSNNNYKNWQSNCLDNLRNRNFKYIAIANPEIAPYGQAAKEVLLGLKLWDEYQSNLVFGNNISQAFVTTSTKNADMGFIAMSDYINKIKGSEKNQECLWIPDDNLYQPLIQKAVILRDSKTAREFMSFLKKAKAIDIIKRAGYGV